MPKNQGTVRTAIQPHDFENRDQTASHDSLLPLNLNLKKKKNTEKQALNSPPFKLTVLFLANTG